MAGRRYELSRRAVVAGAEQLVVGAGTFSTVRLELSEESRFEGEQGEQEGTEWLARGVGLVRYEQRVGGRVVYALELVELDNG